MPHLATGVEHADKRPRGALGVTLVERSSTKLLLTLEGREIAQRTRDILTAVQDLTELASHRSDPIFCLDYCPTCITLILNWN